MRIVARVGSHLYRNLQPMQFIDTDSLTIVRVIFIIPASSDKIQKQTKEKKETQRETRY